MISRVSRRFFAAKPRNNRIPAAGGEADFRSDTVTQPCEKMRDAMHHAVVGDDIYGDDHTTNKLQKDMAEMLGK